MQRYMKRVSGAVAALAIGLSVAGAARAQTPADERAVLATELADLLIADGDVAAIMTPMIDGVWSQLALVLPTVEPAVQQELRAYFFGAFGEMLVGLLEPLRTNALPAFANDIAATLTLDEMRTAVAFYGSPAGRAFVNVAPQVQQILLVELFDLSAARAAGYAIINGVLGTKGLAMIELPGDLVGATPPVPLEMTEAANAARVLVSVTPETMDQVAVSQAIEFVGLFIEEAWEFMPINPAVEDEVYRALDEGMAAYYIDAGRRILDTMALAFATALTPDELNAAVAFVSAPETVDLRAKLEVLGQQQAVRTRAALNEMIGRMAMPVGRLMAGFNDILARHGLPPLPT